MIKIILCVMMIVASAVVLAQNTAQAQSHMRLGHFELPNSRRATITALEERLEPFYHGVASGDPTSDGVVIWTRVTPRDADVSIPVRWVIALDTGLTQPVKQGSTVALLEKDYTVKIDLTGLQSNTVYYYAFQAYDKASLIGRTRTFPISGAEYARVAVVSCSNYPAGYFNAYGAIAKRNDIDVVLHLGDYIYEYGADSLSYAGATGKQLGRMHAPANEIISLADYRARYNQYRLDPDLRALHQQHPVVHVYDDHESANDSYTDGAENHQAAEGDWQVRKGLSLRACQEWMPTREYSGMRIYRRLLYGELVDITMLDTRLDGRDKQIEDLGKDASASAKAELESPTRKLISTTQFDWLVSELTSSAAQWHLIGNQVLFTQFNVESIDTAYMFNAVGPLYAAFLRPQVPALQNLIESAFYGDVWSNYPAQRKALCDALMLAKVNNVIISTGDFHCSFATDVEQTWKGDTTSVAVEFVTPSVTSPNFDENLSSQAFLRPILNPLLATIDTTLYKLNDHLLWSDIVNHGYQIIDIKSDRVQADWFFMKTTTTRTTEESWARGYVVNQGTARALLTVEQAPGKQRQDVPAPFDPPSIQLSAGLDEPLVQKIKLMSFGPVPVTSALTLTLHAMSDCSATVYVITTSGERVVEQDVSLPGGISTLAIDTGKLSQGSYLVALRFSDQQIAFSVVVKR